MGKIEKKKKRKNPQFPNIYRIITEKTSKTSKKAANSTKSIDSATFKLALLIYFCLMLLAGIVLVGFDLYKSLQTKSQIEYSRGQILREIKVWQSISDKYSGYKDAYFQLANLEYQIGDFEKSRFYLDKTLLLDPNFEEAQSLEKALRNR